VDIGETVMKHVDSLDPRASIFVAGSWSEPTGTFDVEDPATGTVIAQVGNGTPADARAAVTAAQDALPGWRALAPRERSEILRRAYELILLDIDRLASLIMAENGKTEQDARGEVAYAAEFFRWFAEESVRSSGRYGESPAGGARVVVTHRSVGVAALVTPWNFPAAMLTRKLAPALAAGCTTVLKPAGETPLTALAVVRLLTEAGVPDGVVNIVPTLDAPGVVTAWLEDPRVRKVSFTGSTNVGRILLRQAADRVVNSSMELGGNAPFVVTEDADVEKAVAGALVAKFRNGGQACTAANRFYVHEDVVEEFVARFGAAVADLRVGPAADAGTQIGPMITARALANITALVEEAVSHGARMTHRAELPDQLTGYFYPPTILSGVHPDAAILQQEIFGPVAPIVTWRTDDELLELVNSSEFGLAAYVFAGRLQRALRIAEGTEAGMVGINRGLVSDPSAPFGGMKQSGLGREGAREGLEEFTETQYFSVDWSE
jgi:succinate-semialdehyde dehydrogenase/glutarate-semialdehyde dehydrogenase